jgi:hypothetical protein
VGEHRITVGYRVRHERFEIVTHSRVGVLTQHQRRAGVMNKNVTEAPLDTATGHCTLHMVRDIVGPPPGSGDLKAVLVEHFQNLSSC